MLQAADAPGQANDAALVAPLPPVVQQHGMTLADWESLALQNNPTLSQAAARLEAMRGEWQQVGLYPNPRVGYQANEINDDRKAGQQGAYFGQEIVTAGKLRLSRDVVSQAICQAQFAYEAQKDRVENDVRSAFFDVLVAQRSIELTDQLVRIGNQSVEAAEKLFSAKEVSRVDILQAKVESESAQILAQKARNRHTSAWRALLAVTGVGDMPMTPLIGDLQDSFQQLVWEETLQHILDSSPMVAQARTGVARAQAELDRQCAERVPNIDIMAGAAYDNATKDAIAGVQAGVPLPLFNRNQGNIRKAQAEVVAARAEVTRVELDLRQQLAAVFEQYQNAKFQVEKYNAAILPNARSSLDLVAAGYQQGEFNYVALLTAQRTFFQANLAYLDAMRDLRQAIVDIEGDMLSDSLQQR